MRLLMWAVLLLTFGFMSAAVAQDGRGDDRSAKAVLPQCAAGLDVAVQNTAGGRCAGIIATLSFVSRVLPDNLKFCQPSGATPEQMLQAVTSFVDSNPDSAVQDFRLVALAAMHQKWPCQE